MSQLDELLFAGRKLSIIDYEVSISIGVTARERAEVQPVLISADVWIPAGQCICDSISSTYDYTRITRIIDEAVTARSFCLQETLVDTLAAKILADSTVRAVRVRSCKIRALDKCAGAAVEIVRLQRS